MKLYTLIFFVLFVTKHTDLYSQSTLPLSADAGITINHFQQQIKQEVGDERGERLVEESGLGLELQLRYALADWVDVGVFLNYDVGTRKAARFVGFDSSGKTVTSSNLGGDFSEIWFGPIVRASWKQLFLEAGYAIAGSRSDDGRTDVHNISQDSTSNFSLKPGIAWLLGIGGKLSITEQIYAVIKIEYRFRYYDERNNEPLIDGIEHGTQSVAPYIGVQYQF
jgi:hypothetical protein